MLTETASIAAVGADRPPMGAYVARPAGPAPRSGVLVAGELFGISAHVRDVCERLAQLGHVALAPDLHHRVAPGIELAHDAAGRRRGFDLLGEMTREQVLDDLRAASDHLRQRGCEQIGILGLSVGGHIAYLAASELDLAAAAVVYGGWLVGSEIPLSRPEPTLALTPGIRGRVLVLVGERDHVVPPEDRRAIAGALLRAGVQHEVIEYPGAQHGYLCSRRQSFDAAAAADSWERIAALFAATLL